ncbi:MAG: hypothetical protein ACREC1_04580 [Methylovirgula sp.]
MRAPNRKSYAGRPHPGKAAFEVGEDVDPLVAALQRTQAGRGRAS